MNPTKTCILFLGLWLCGPAAPAQSLPDPMVDSDPALSRSPDGPRVTGRIPVTRYDVYQLNNAEYIDGLFDGDTTRSVHPGWGHVLRAQETWIRLRDYHAQVSQLQLMNDYYHASPVQYYAVERGTWKRVLLGTSNGQPAHGWNRLPAAPLSTPVNASYIVIVGEPHFPKELRILGSYVPKVAAPAPVRVRPPFRHTIGNNFFEWDALENDTDPNDRYRIQENKMATLKIFKGGLRHYLDWERIETARGVYEFNPTNHGGWDYDMIYRRLKAEGVPVVVCLKTLPFWMLQSWPETERDAENVPVFFRDSLAGTIASFEDPASYTDGARLFFQLAARYGRNAAIDPALQSGVVTGRIWPQVPTSPVRTREAGLDLVEYLEIENERDKWWKGRKAYQTGREYAAMASAYYDGHKGSLGPGVGAKTADPTMKIVIGGLALAHTDYIQGMVDWCRQYRGYKANGEVDLCFDILNYHQYSNDAGSTQHGYATRGRAPELSGISEGIDRFLKLSNDECHGREVWITESGFDVHPGSTQRAMAIGGKSGRDVQADWILRSSLLFAKKGIDRVMYYMFKDVWGDNNGGTFATSGFVESNALQSTRRPAADFLLQADALIGRYRYSNSLGTDPVVDRYVLGDSSVYVAWIPDETGRTGTCTLTLPPRCSRVKVYTPTRGSDTMQYAVYPVSGGVHTLSVSETPLFVVPLMDVALPLRWLSFDGQFRAATRDVFLQWSTADASSTDFFVVERAGGSADRWDSIGRVAVHPGQQYVFVDEQPLAGQNRYRLRQVDTGGRAAFSPIVTVSVSGRPGAQVTPNPARGRAYLRLYNAAEEVITLQLSDNGGRILWRRTYKVAPNTALPLSLSGYAAGVYYLSIGRGGVTATEPLVIQ